jgi:hypothetical protein
MCMSPILLFSWLQDTNEYGFELEFNSQLLQETARTRTVTVHFKARAAEPSPLQSLYGTRLVQKRFKSRPAGTIAMSG